MKRQVLALFFFALFAFAFFPQASSLSHGVRAVSGDWVPLGDGSSTATFTVADYIMHQTGSLVLVVQTMDILVVDTGTPFRIPATADGGEVVYEARGVFTGLRILGGIHDVVDMAKYLPTFYVTSSLLPPYIGDYCRSLILVGPDRIGDGTAKILWSYTSCPRGDLQ